MIESSCHCGAVKLVIDGELGALTQCNCTICRRYGTLCAYFSPAQVKVSGATDIYLRGDKMIEFHRCKVCGCVTHWAPIDKAADRMGVNCRLMEPSVLAGVRVRKLDGLDTWKFLDE